MSPNAQPVTEVLQTETRLVPHFQRVNTATLIIGVSGSGKTSVLHTFFEYVWETYKRVTLFYSCDGGAFPTLIQRDIQYGIARVWRMRTRSGKDLAFETCYKATRGYWPRRINPSTGETDPTVELVAPVQQRFEMSCPNGHVVKTVPAEQLLTPQMCPTCRTLTNLQNGSVKKTMFPTKGFEAVGACAFDGLTSMCSWMQNELGQRAGRLELKGEEAAIGGKVVSGDMAFGGSTRSHVGFVQERSQELVNNALSIPNLVASPVFTALSMEALDEGNLSIRGPRLAGKAKADEAQAWFGNVLETAVVGNEKPGERIRRLYLSEFIDTDNVRHLLKNSGSGALPPYIEDPPEDPSKIAQQFSGFNLGNFFRMLDQDLVRAMETPIEGAPGMPSGIVEIGEPATVQQGPVVQGNVPQQAAGAKGTAVPAGNAGQPSGGAQAKPTAATSSQPAGAPAVQSATQQGTAAQAPQQASTPAAPRATGRAKAAARPAQPQAPVSQTPAAPAPAQPQPPAQQDLPVEGAAPQAQPQASTPAQAAPASPTAAAAPVASNATPAPRAAAPPPAAPRPPVAAPRVPPRAASAKQGQG